VECPSEGTSLLLTVQVLMFQWQTGVCVETLTEHSETVTALVWLPNGSGFISGALDGKVIHWVSISRTVWGFLLLNLIYEPVLL